MLEAGSFFSFFLFLSVFNLEAAPACRQEATLQEVGALECGCVGEVNLVEVDEKRFERNLHLALPGV